MKLSSRKLTRAEQKFVNVVLEYHKTHGRHTLLWRQTNNPYQILVSEMMLQQTQVARVILKYKAFLKKFPTTKSLAEAPLKDVLLLWQGLGYNRRAKYLKEAANTVHEAYRGRWPRTYDELIALPGIGPYTAGAIMAFAYNKPVTMIETNIRTVYLHHFFPLETNVPDAALLPVIERTCDHRNPRAWYAALMDYGSYLKQTTGNVSRRSKHHTIQSRFKGSDREIRGAILRQLLVSPGTEASLINALGCEAIRLHTILATLVKDGLVVKRDDWYSVALM